MCELHNKLNGILHLSDLMCVGEAKLNSNK